MFNEVFQVIIAVVAIAIFIVVFYYFAKESSASSRPVDKITDPEILEESVTEILETPSQALEHPTDLISRRKSDKTIPKRSVPNHTKITK